MFSPLSLPSHLNLLIINPLEVRSSYAPSPLSSFLLVDTLPFFTDARPPFIPSLLPLTLYLPTFTATLAATLCVVSFSSVLSRLLCPLDSVFRTGSLHARLSVSLPAARIRSSLAGHQPSSKHRAAKRRRRRQAEFP